MTFFFPGWWIWRAKGRARWSERRDASGPVECLVGLGLNMFESWIHMNLITSTKIHIPMIFEIVSRRERIRSGTRRWTIWSDRPVFNALQARSTASFTVQGSQRYQTGPHFGFLSEPLWRTESDMLEVRHVGWKLFHISRKSKLWSSSDTLVGFPLSHHCWLLRSCQLRLRAFEMGGWNHCHNAVFLWPSIWSIASSSILSSSSSSWSPSRTHGTHKEPCSCQQGIYTMLNIVVVIALSQWHQPILESPYRKSHRFFIMQWRKNAAGTLRGESGEKLMEHFTAEKSPWLWGQVGQVILVLLWVMTSYPHSWSWKSDSGFHVDPCANKLCMYTHTYYYIFIITCFCHICLKLRRPTDMEPNGETVGPMYLHPNDRTVNL